MDPKVFLGFRQLAYKHAGIALRDNKEALVSARIAKRVRSLNLNSELAYLEYLKNDKSGEELISFLDVISTNFTSFYRENDHFDLLREELATRVKQGANRIRIWCAAASTGEEPYTLAMTLAESLEHKVDDWRLLATDISLRVLEAASEGAYEAEKLSGVPRNLRDKYFRKVPGTAEEPDMLRVIPALRERIVFKRLNLSTLPFPLGGGLDVVFCRNVMIYFDMTVRQPLVNEVERLLRPGGLLVIAHSETLNGLQTGMTMVKPSVYRKAS
ncbi:MAG: protein-glutamate O-methyltransferase CheR [Pseudomonadota bacterium]